ncbi:putative transcription protein [Ochromonadaceae sp. CCMP2298]|nr:putative transcription protein [Ochromonadaceae sp. CCMP2298]
MEEEYEMAEMPDKFKDLRACLRCSLIKTFEQFVDRGCENCDFLEMEGNTMRVHQCTSACFEGLIALVEPRGSWVGKWQQISQYQPGMYAIDMAGELPPDAVEICEDRRLPYKSNKAAAKHK